MNSYHLQLQTYELEQLVTMDLEACGCKFSILMVQDTASLTSTFSETLFLTNVYGSCGHPVTGVRKVSLYMGGFPVCTNHWDESTVPLADFYIQKAEEELRK